MIKKQLLFILICGMMLPLLWGQSTNGVYVHEGQKYSKNNGDWYQVAGNKMYKVVDNQLVIMFKSSTTDSLRVQFEQQHGLTKTANDPSGWFYYNYLPTPNQNVFGKVNSLKAAGIVKDVVIPKYGHLNATLDPIQNYYMDQDVGTIGVENAWTIEAGSSNIKIAIIDAGVDMNHVDLQQNLYSGNNDHYDFIDDDGDPFPTSGMHHGTQIAGIIGGTVNNNHGLAGIAAGTPANKGCQLQIYRVADNTGVDPGDLVSAIYRAVNNYTDIINLSMDIPQQPNIVQAIEDAYASGVIVIASSGNGGVDAVSFPANMDEVIAVGGHTKPTSSITQITRLSNSNYGEELVISAPGNGIKSINNNNAQSGWLVGNSYSAAIVSGVVGLMKSANQCLGFEQAKSILQATGKKVGNYGYEPYYHPKYGFNTEMGFGQVDAYEAVLKTSQTMSVHLDLYMQDRIDDIGYDPDNDFYWNFDNSPDIWVRNTNDGFTNQTYENPVYNGPGDEAYVYVRVRNKSCVNSNPTDILQLYVTPHSTGDSWPGDWDLVKSKVMTKIIGFGETEIYEFKWELDDFSNETGACFIATIDAPPDDPKPPFVSGDGLGVYIRENNNVAMRNVTITKTKSSFVWDNLDVPPGAPVYIGNHNYDDSKEFNIGFGYTEDNNSRMLDEAELKVFVKDEFWNIVDNSPDVQFNGIEISEDDNLLINSTDPCISRLRFEPSSQTQVYMSYSFYGEYAEDEDETFYYVVKQIESEEELLTGNLHYQIIKEARDRFEADAGGDEVIFTGQSANLSGNTLNESADYKWHKLGDSTKVNAISMSASPLATSKYVYEVIADSDGFKSYDTLNVYINPYKIKSLTPNPASTTLNIEYVADKAKTASIRIQMTADPKVNMKFNIDPALTSKTVNVASLPKGVYNVVLICDGKQVSADNLMIQ